MFRKVNFDVFSEFMEQAAVSASDNRSHFRWRIRFSPNGSAARFSTAFAAARAPVLLAAPAFQSTGPRKALNLL
jgi:hypothetical protein